jgi:hypothetical protein
MTLALHNTNWLYNTGIKLLLCRCYPKKEITYSNICPTRCNFTQFIYIWKLLYMFRGGTCTHHQERIQLYLQHLAFVTPLLLSAAISWNRFECVVGGVRHPQHTLTGSNSSTIAADSSNGVTNTVDTGVCAPDDGWKYHPKHVEQFPDINKLCNVASCWIYIKI